MSVGRRHIVRTHARRAKRAARVASPHTGARRFLANGEDVLLATRQHPFAIGASITRSLRLLIPVVLIAWGSVGVDLLRSGFGDIITAVCLAVAAVQLARMAWAVVQWECCRVYVTSENVMVLTGVLHRRMAATPLSKVSEFAVRQSLVGRIADYGALVVDVPGGRPDAMHGLRFLPDPSGLYRLVVNTAKGGRLSGPAVATSASTALTSTAPAPHGVSSVSQPQPQTAAATVRARVEDVPAELTAPTLLGRRASDGPSVPAPDVQPAEHGRIGDTTRLPAIRTFGFDDET